MSPWRRRQVAVCGPGTSPRAERGWGVADDVSRLLVGFVSQVDVDDDSVRMLQKVRDACRFELSGCCGCCPRAMTRPGGYTSSVVRVRVSPTTSVWTRRTSCPTRWGRSACRCRWPLGRGTFGYNTYRLGVDASVGTGSIDHVGLDGSSASRRAASRPQGLRAGPGDAPSAVPARDVRVGQQRISMPRTGRLEGDLMRADVALCADLDREGWKTQRSLARYLKRLDDLLVLQVTFRDVHGNRLIRGSTARLGARFRGHAVGAPSSPPSRMVVPLPTGHSPS